MKVLAWSLSFLVLILLASPVALLKGCGSNDLCGGCPSDSVAPARSTLTAVSEDESYTVPPEQYCVSNLTFKVNGRDGLPMNNICVEVFTNSLIALSSAPGDCRANTGYAGYIRTRTDGGGTVTVDFATPILACNATDQTFFVQVSSCGVGATWVGTWKVPCP